MAKIAKVARRGAAVLIAGLVTLIVVSPAAALPPTAESTLSELGDGVHANSIAFGPDGALWFASSVWAYGKPAQVGRVAADGTVTEFPIPVTPAAGGATSIVAGADGAMWFALPDADSIGRVTMDGQVAVRPLFEGATEPLDKHDLLQPRGLSVGPEGDIWFAESHAGRIARIDPTGLDVAEFQLGRRSKPLATALGPGGDIWFTLRGVGKIGQISTGGTIVLHRLRPSIEPLSIAGNADSLWFSERPSNPLRNRAGSNRLGHVDAAGSIHQFRVPSEFGTNAVAVAPDGSAWFSGGSRLATIESIAPSGELGPRSCLDKYCELPPSSFAFAPDGSLWFGTEEQRCVYCGGGSQMYLSTKAGFVGRLTAAGS